MPRHFESTLPGQGVRIGIVLARFNEAVTSRLLEGALTALRERGVADADLERIMVDNPRRWLTA